MPDDISGTSLAGYGAETYECYHCTCVYCGFDGRGFDAWMQLTVDHLRPRKVRFRLRDDQDRIPVRGPSVFQVRNQSNY